MVAMLPIRAQSIIDRKPDISNNTCRFGQVKFHNNSFHNSFPHPIAVFLFLFTKELKSVCWRTITFKYNWFTRFSWYNTFKCKWSPKFIWYNIFKCKWSTRFSWYTTFKCKWSTRFSWYTTFKCKWSTRFSWYNIFKCKWSTRFSWYTTFKYKWSTKSCWTIMLPIVIAVNFSVATIFILKHHGAIF